MNVEAIPGIQGYEKEPDSAEQKAQNVSNTLECAVGFHEQRESGIPVWGDN